MTDTDCLLEHTRAPYHRGRFAEATHVHTGGHRTCGDQVCLQLHIDDAGVITAAWHEGRGCLISQAAASILCEHLEGQPAQTVAALRPRELLNLLGTPLTPGRVACALVAFDALNVLLREWAVSNGARLTANCV